jgi:hypothetical protein
MPASLIGITSILAVTLVAPYAAAAEGAVTAVPATAGVGKVDDYTVHRLIVLNDKGQVLLLKNEAGWHTPASRANEGQSIREALASLAGSLGLAVEPPTLAGFYTYKFEGLPDHRQVSFRTHFITRATAGTLIQPGEAGASHHWVAVEKAVPLLSFDSLRLETDTILKNPGQVWGGSFLIVWKDDVYQDSRVLEAPYALSE